MSYSYNNILSQASEFIRENAVKPKQSFGFSVITDSQWHRIGSSESYIASLKNNGLSITYKNFTTGENINRFIRNDLNDFIFTRKSLLTKNFKKSLTSNFEHGLISFSTLPDLTPQRTHLTPYFQSKLKSHDDLIKLGIKEAHFYKGKIYTTPSRGSIPVAVLPIKNLQGDITGFQFFSNNKDLDADKSTNKIIIGKKQGSFAYIGKELKDSTKQFIGEGAATVLSSKSFIDFKLKTDCLIIGIDSGNLKEIVKNNKDLLTNPFFIADNDVIDTSKPYSKNTGLLTAIECLYELGLQNEKRIYVPISQNGEKTDFNDLEFQENHLFELLSAIDVIEKYPLFSKNTKNKMSIGLKTNTFINDKCLTVKNLIKESFTNIDKYQGSLVEINSGNNVKKYKLIFNGIDLFLMLVSINDKPFNGLSLIFIPIIEYFFNEKKNKLIPHETAMTISKFFESSNANFIKNELASMVQKINHDSNIDKHGIQYLDCSDALIDGKYINSSTAKMDFKTFYLMAGVGMGKTEFINTTIKQTRELNSPILSIASLRSLVASQSTRFNLVSYSENKLDNQMVTTLHSLHKIADFFISEFEMKKNGVLILDEITHLLNIFNSNTLQTNPVTLLNKLKKLITLADKVIVADAYLSINQVAFDFIADLRKISTSIIIDAKPVISQRKLASVYDDFEGISSNCLNALQNGNRAIFMLSSNDKAKQIYELIKSKHPKLKGILINSETSNDAEQVRFLSSPNNEIKKYHYLIHTPSINGGVSFNDAIDMPDFIKYAYLNNGITAPQDAMQMLARFRRKTDLHICFANKLSYSKIFNEHEILQKNKHTISELIDFFEYNTTPLSKEQSEYVLSVLKNAVENSTELSDLDKFLSKWITHEIFSKDNFANIFPKLLADYGYDLMSSNETSLEVKEALDVAKETVLINDTKNVINANKIDDLEYIKINKSLTVTSAQRYSKIRYDIENNYGLEINHENVGYILANKEVVKNISANALVFMDKEPVAFKSLKQYDFERETLKTKVRVKNHFFVREYLTSLLTSVGVKITSKGLEIPNNHKVELSSLSSFFAKIKTKNYKLNIQMNGLGTVTATFDKNKQWINSQLKRFGLTIDKDNVLTVKDANAAKISVHYARVISGHSPNRKTDCN